MNKTLRFSIFSIMMMLCGVAFSQTTIDFDNNYATLFPTLAGTSSSESHDGDFTEETTSTAVNGITVTVSAKTSGTNDNRIWSSAPRLRLYSGTLTIKSSQTFKKVVFSNFATNSSLIANNNTVSTGTLSKVTKNKGENVTWTGEAKEIVITIAGNTQIGKIEVFAENEGGDDPDPEEFTGPTVDNIAAFKQLEVGTEAKLTLTNAKVLFVGERDVYIRDASGAIDFYQTGLTFANGQCLNGSVIGKFDTYNNVPEFTKTNFTKADGFTAVTDTVKPKEIGLDEIAGYICDLVLVKGVTIAKEEDGNYYASNGDDKVQVFDKFKIGYESSLKEGESYDILGIAVPYKEIVEICPIEDFTGGFDDSATPVASIAELLTLDSPSNNLELTLTNAEVLFNDGNYIYVRENGKCVCFYKVDAISPMFTTNAIANGKIKVDYEVYKLLPEVKANQNTTAEDMTASITEGYEATPTETTVAQVAAGDNVCDLVKLTGTVTKETSSGGSNTYYLNDGEAKIVAANNSMGLDKLFTEGVTEVENVTVVGIVNTNNNAYRVKLTKKVGNTTGINEVNTLSTGNDVRYNLAGQRINGSYKGIVISNGKKIVVK